jgi:biopolymer transport protein ExbD
MAADIPDPNSDSDDYSPVSAINVTPFVDVVLVLLVIFMVTAPAMMKNVLGIQLPKAASNEQKMPDSVGIAINRENQVYFNGTVISIDELATKTTEALAKNPSVQAIISADEKTLHGEVVKVIDIIKQAGIIKFALEIRKPADQNP